ncbi:MAG: response regulator transcription factor [Chitinophagaceae bacterium]|nr:response regulator transcription factor [Chitinophagaceae bacterium]
MLNCIIIDDEQPAINIIASYVKNIPYLNLITTTTSAVEGIGIVTRQKTDLIFLDIQMPDITGIDFIKAINGKSKVIIISAYSQYALDGFELEVIDYLLKPVSFARFLKATQKAWDLLGSAAQPPAATADFIMLKGEGKGKFVKVEWNDIDYIESMGNYTAIHSNGKKITSLITMKELEDKLPRQKFIRVHKSFIVPVAKVVSIHNNTLMLKNCNIEIQVGDTYKTAFFEVIKIQ